MAERLSRQELYDLVWSQPLRTLSERFGISDVALKKTCVKALIPTPERGYWARKDAGQRVVQIALPVRPPGMEDEVGVAAGGKWWYREEKDELQSPLPPPPTFAEPIEVVRERIARTIGKVTVPRSVTNWHPALDALLKEDEKRREEQRTSPYPGFWNKPRFDTPQERRRLRILNSLFLAVTKMNGSASQGQEKEGHFYVTFYHRNVGMTLVPLRQTRRNSAPGGEPTGAEEPRLILSIQQYSQSSSVRFSWQDEDASKLEDHITEITVQTILAAEIQHREDALHHYQFLVQDRARMEAEEKKRQIEAERAEQERRKKAEQAKIDLLLCDATAFQQADQIRKYVDSVRMRLESVDSPAKGEFDAWSKWALAEADRIDPSIGGAYLASMAEAVSKQS